MVIIGSFKPRGIQVQIRDDLNKVSKSFTIHGMSFNKLYYRILFYTQQLAKFKHIKLICKEDKNGEKETD